jgi:hypothetical protein
MCDACAWICVRYRLINWWVMVWDGETSIVCSLLMTNQLIRRRSTSMKIFLVILLNLFILKCSSSCLPCTTKLFRSCYNCLNRFPFDRSHVERVSIICSRNHSIFQEHERFYSIIKSYTTRKCTMKIFYLDQYTLWNYLESLSITYAHLTHLSPVIFNRSLSF